MTNQTAILDILKTSHKWCTCTDAVTHRVGLVGSTDSTDQLLGHSLSVSPCEMYQSTQETDVAMFGQVMLN